MGLTFSKIKRHFPLIFNGEILNKKEQQFVISQYKEYFLPFYRQAEKLKEIDYETEDLPAQDFTSIMTPFYAAMNKKSCGCAWKRILRLENEKSFLRRESNELRKKSGTKNS